MMRRMICLAVLLVCSAVWMAVMALDVVLGNFWFIPYKIRLGVSAVYVHGNPDPDAKPYEINLVLNVDL